MQHSYFGRFPSMQLFKCEAEILMFNGCMIVIFQFKIYLKKYPQRDTTSIVLFPQRTANFQ